LVSLKKRTQNGPRHVYQFVPVQDFKKPWTDEKLYKKYNLTQDEIAYIEKMIRPMVLSGE
jgi:site-specific DNA-methyltransferase (adenine-specific)